MVTPAAVLLLVLVQHLINNSIITLYMKIIFKILILALVITISNSVTAQSLAPMVIGTINAGDSVVIYYDATINASAGAQVSNQGTITGSNFSSFVTDDPDTGPLADQTITSLNIFLLPVTMYSLSAAQKANGIEVAWNVTAESNLLKYEVERSTDGRNFTKIGEVGARNSGQATRYAFTDVGVNGGTVYYRLKIIDRSAPGRYSAVVKVDLAVKVGNVTVFPNPAAQKQITLQISNMAKGTYKLELYNGVGQPVYIQTIQHDGGSLSRGFTLPASITAGMYYVKVRTGKEEHIQPLIVK
jgi:hypothetical protein